MEQQKQVIVLNGIQYTTEEAVPEVLALIKDLGTIQTELIRLKTSYDIATVAKSSVIRALADIQVEGNSGLIELINNEDHDDTPVEDKISQDLIDQIAQAAQATK